MSDINARYKGRIEMLKSQGGDRSKQSNFYKVFVGKNLQKHDKKQPNTYKKLRNM